MGGLFRNDETPIKSTQTSDPVVLNYGVSSSSSDLVSRIRQIDGVSLEIAKRKAELIHILERQNAPLSDFNHLINIRPPNNTTEDGKRLWAEAERQLFAWNIQEAYE